MVLFYILGRQKSHASIHIKAVDTTPDDDEDDVKLENEADDDSTPPHSDWEDDASSLKSVKIEKQDDDDEEQMMKQSEDEDEVEFEDDLLQPASQQDPLEIKRQKTKKGNDEQDDLNDDSDLGSDYRVPSSHANSSSESEPEESDSS